MHAFLILLSMASAHNGDLDGLGCHIEPNAKTYHCHEGPLAGRNFVSKQAAVAALTALGSVPKEDEKPKELEAEETAEVEERAPATPASSIGIQLMLWNARHLGREARDLEQVAELVAASDLVVFTDAGVSFLAREALNRLVKQISTGLGEKICRAWTEPVKGENVRHAILWKDRKIAFVKSSGVALETCPEADLAIKTHAVLLERSSRQHFTVQPARSGATPATVADWPALMAGELGAKPADGFSVSPGSASASEVLWLRRFVPTEVRALDLIREYPDLKMNVLRAAFSDRRPIRAELRFVHDDDQVVPRLPSGEDY